MGFFNKTAGTDVATRTTAMGNSLLNKATQVYRNNPKTVGGIALIASALLLTRMKSGRR